MEYSRRYITNVTKINDKNLAKGPFNNYENKSRWVGGQTNVYYCKVNTLFLFTVFVY